MQDPNDQSTSNGTLYCPVGVISHDGVLMTYEFKEGKPLVLEAYTRKEVEMTPELAAAVESDRRRMEAKRSTGQRLSDLADEGPAPDESAGPGA